MKRRQITRALVGAALAAASVLPQLLPATADAQEVCFPTPLFVPGGFSGSPRWSSSLPNTGLVINSVNEPRWGAFDPQRFFNDQGSAATSAGVFRFIRQGNYLYVSLQARNDDERDARDFVSFGMFNEVTEKGRVITIPLNVGAADPAPASGVQYAEWDAVGDRWSALRNGQPPDGWVVNNSIGSFTRLGVTDGGADWAVQFVVDLTKLDLTSDSTEFKLYMLMRTYLPDAGAMQPILSVPQRPAAPTVITPVGDSQIDSDRSRWLTTTLGAPCAEGIEFRATTDIGVARGLPTDIPSHQIDLDPGDVNTFTARPTWTGLNPSDWDPGDVTATFRIADWGAQMDGVDPFQAVPGLIDVPHNRANGRFDKACPANADGRVCGGNTTTPVGLSTTSPSQCMIVELKSAVGVPIKTPIQWRNMRFESLSRRELPAVINAKGMRARNGIRGEQTVLVDVITRNMPKPGNWPLFLDSLLLNHLKQLLVGILNELNPFGVSLDLDQQMKMAWPTYEVHTYYSTGRTYSYKGQTFTEYSPMNSFGYYFSHSGLFFGYTQSLGGSAVDRLRNDTYTVRVPEEGRSTLTTFVRTEDLPAIVTGLIGTIEDIGCAVFPLCAR